MSIFFNKTVFVGASDRIKTSESIESKIIVVFGLFMRRKQPLPLISKSDESSFLWKLSFLRPKPDRVSICADIYCT